MARIEQTLHLHSICRENSLLKAGINASSEGAHSRFRKSEASKCTMSSSEGSALGSSLMLWLEAAVHGCEMHLASSRLEANPIQAGCRRNFTFLHHLRGIETAFDGLVCVAAGRSLAQPPLNLAALRTFA